METIKPKEFFKDRKSIEEIKNLINAKASNGILIIPIKKTMTSKKIAMSVQLSYAINRAQQYAMYINYANGGAGSEMRVVESRTSKNGKLFIHGYYADNGKHRNMVVTYDLINKNGIISYVEIFKQ